MRRIKKCEIELHDPRRYGMLLYLTSENTAITILFFADISKTLGSACSRACVLVKRCRLFTFLLLSFRSTESEVEWIGRQLRNAKRGKLEIPEKTRRLAASSSKIAGLAKIPEHRKQGLCLIGYCALRKVPCWSGHLLASEIAGADWRSEFRNVDVYSRISNSLSCAKAALKGMRTRTMPRRRVNSRRRPAPMHGGLRAPVASPIAQVNHHASGVHHGQGCGLDSRGRSSRGRTAELVEAKSRDATMEVIDDGVATACLLHVYQIERSPPTKANRVRLPAGSPPDFRWQESCRTIPLVGRGFSGGSPVSSAIALHFGAAPFSPHFTLIVCQDPDAKRRPSHMRAKQGEDRAASECKVGRKERSLRKPADQRHQVRFPRARIRERHRRESYPVRLGGRRAVFFCWGWSCPSATPLPTSTKLYFGYDPASYCGIDRRRKRSARKRAAAAPSPHVALSRQWRNESRPGPVLIDRTAPTARATGLPLRKARAPRVNDTSRGRGHRAVNSLRCTLCCEDPLLVGPLAARYIQYVSRPGLVDGVPTCRWLSGTAHLPPRRTGFNHRPGHSRIFASGNRAGRCHWLAGFLGDLPLPPPLAFRHCSILTSFHLMKWLSSSFESSSALKTSLFRATLRPCPNSGKFGHILNLSTQPLDSSPEPQRRSTACEYGNRSRAGEN
ncbi:hypothetical protein PR048_006311 [Dryococelus australis]|uniref:Uncharacterized protein n=1 Tax=Dryococelus australis TaxID=614101 RepID=A0ABQ9IAP2_9NEOP|nr:hypothetical protein PR048_006311 [Dryococelus australis]